MYIHSQSLPFSSMIWICLHVLTLPLNKLHSSASNHTFEMCWFTISFIFLMSVEVKLSAYSKRFSNVGFFADSSCLSSLPISTLYLSISFSDWDFSASILAILAWYCFLVMMPSTYISAILAFFSSISFKSFSLPIIFSLNTLMSASNCSTKLLFGCDMNSMWRMLATS